MKEMGRITKQILLVVAACGLALASHMGLAASSMMPPGDPWNDNVALGTLQVKPAETLMLGVETIRLERTTLGEILSKAKSGVVKHRGDAAASEYWVCYSIPDESMPQRLWLISHGEMGGSEHSVTAAIGEVISRGMEVSDSCPILPKRLRPVKLENNIWIGTGMQDLEKILGRPSQERGELLSYVYEGPSKHKYKEYWSGKEKSIDVTESNILNVLLRNNNVFKLWIYKGTSD